MPNRLQLCFAAILAAASFACAPPSRAQMEATTMLLVARPQLNDPYFQRSVVLVLRHGKSRPIGVILNRPLDTPPHKEGETPATPQFLGGPVMPSGVVFMFKSTSASVDVLSLGAGLYLGFGQDLLDRMTQLQPPPVRLRVFRGFAVWSPGQLENELARGDWLPLPMAADEVLRGDVRNLWEELYAKANERPI
jgi:putative transcriptional regulator